MDMSYAAPQRRKWSPVVLVTIAAVVLAGVLGASFLITKLLLGSSPQAGPPVEGQLRGTFPDKPSVGWRLAAGDVAPRAQFVRPDSQARTYRGVGFIDLGHTLITSIYLPDTDRPEDLVAIDAVSGKVRWTTALRAHGDASAGPDRTGAVCATRVINGTLPCLVGQAEVQFFDLADGSVNRSHPVRDARIVEVYGSSVYTMGYKSMSRGTAADLAADWQRSYTIDPPCADSGDSLRYGVNDDIVYFGSYNNVVVVSTEDGHRLIDQEVADPQLFSGQGIVAQTCTNSEPSATVTVDNTGRQLHREAGTDMPATPWLVDSSAQVPYVVGNRAYEFGGSRQLWTASGASATVKFETIIGDIVLGTDTDPASKSNLVAYDLGTGERLWTLEHDGIYRVGGGMSDGERVIVQVGHDGGIAAVNLATGELDWTMPEADYIAFIAPAGAGFAAASPDTITYYPPTGGPSVAPGHRSAAKPEDDGGLITKCGKVPEMHPVSFRAANGALIVTMEIKATCPSGDVLSSNRFRVKISDGTGPIAEGFFDFSSEPLVLEGGKSTTLDFTFDGGGIWRLPNTLGETSGASSGSGEVITETKATGKELVDCDDEGTNTGPTSTRSAPGKATGVNATGNAGAQGCGSDQQALDALRVQVDSDRPFVQRGLADHWVAQLSAKHPGLVAPDVDGRVVTWTPCEILRQHLRLRLQYPEVRLVWSDEWRTFDLRGWWVTIAGVTFPVPDAANGWCDQRGIPVDECFAKVVSNGRDSSGSTQYRR